MSWLFCCASSRQDKQSHLPDDERSPLLISAAPSAARDRPTLTTIASNAQSDPIIADENVPLVYVLLDGDADFFKAEYLNHGFHGGRRASIALHERVRLYLQKRDGATTAPRPRIVVMSFCNLWGVSSHIAKKPLQAFVQGFNSSPFASSMVDTGPASQSADNALRNHLEALIPSCHVVLVGGNHDGGLAVVLHRLDAHLLKKVVLLKTTPFVATPLKDMKLSTVVFEDLFDGRDPRPDGQRGTTTSGGQAVKNGTAAAAAAATPVSKKAPHTSSTDENATPASTPPTNARSDVAARNHHHAKTPLQAVTRTANEPDQPQSVSSNVAVVKERKSFTDLKQSNERDKYVSNLLRALKEIRDSTGNDKPTLPVIRPSVECGPFAVVDVVKLANERGLVNVKMSDDGQGHYVELVKPLPATTKEDTKTMTSSLVESASLRKIPGRFKELIDILLLLRSKGETSPLRSKVGTLISQSNRNTTFKELCTDAQAFGLVRLAKGKTGGSETISLTEGAIKITLGSSTKPNQAQSQSDSTKPASPPPTTTTTTPELLEENADARKLVAVLALLKQKGNEKPLRSAVGGMLAGKLTTTTFKALAATCQDIGIVELGSGSTTTGHEWIRLAMEGDVVDSCVQEFRNLFKMQ